MISLCHISLVSSHPLRHRTGAGSINWHISVFDNLFNFCLGFCWVDTLWNTASFWCLDGCSARGCLLSAAGSLCLLWQHRFDHQARHPSSQQHTICGALVSTGQQGYSTTWPVLCWLSGHTLRLDSLRRPTFALLASHLLCWCVFLLFQLAYRTPSGRHKGSLCVGATSLPVTVVLGWRLSPQHPTQLGLWATTSMHLPTRPHPEVTAFALRFITPTAVILTLFLL